MRLRVERCRAGVGAGGAGGGRAASQQERYAVAIALEAQEMLVLVGEHLCQQKRNQMCELQAISRVSRLTGPHITRTFYILKFVIFNKACVSSNSIHPSDCHHSLGI